MRYSPERHHRRSIRLRGYDYTQTGGYFITIVAHERALLFGEIVNGAMRLNEYGQIVRDEWFRTLHSGRGLLYHYRCSRAGAAVW